MSIKPTVGRVVWFYPSRTESAEFSQPVLGEPLGAIIAAVLPGHPVDIVNLTVFDATGTPHACTLVPLMQEGQDMPEGSAYATWMPYQIGQAKKAEDREHDAKQLVVAADRAADTRRLHAGIIDLALRTPGLAGYQEVLAAATAYQAHIEGKTKSTQQQRPPLGAAFPGYSTMQPHQQRVVDEKVELDGKLAKLNAFVDGPVFIGLIEPEQSRLRQQLHAMTAYSLILGERIEAF